ncbi:MAG TPA: isoprenyl transferase [Sphingobium sp.]|uniref:isoprenyl transferase n=1 Tax=Sphingobium sp. TaxID=1912891 RepID=UPI002ECFF136
MILSRARLRGKAAPVPAPAVPQGTELPRHVAIIMDGNGRWAARRKLPRLAGHKAGADAVRRVARAARDMGLECLTLYAFSSENWKRPEQEIADLTALLKHFIANDLDEFHANNVRLRVIGDYHAFEPSAVEMVERALAKTAANDGSTMVIALNYGSQNELARATQALARRVASGELRPEEITTDAIAAELDTADLPPLDLLIRTSGEQRLSNFLLWQVAYAELYFTEKLWPDFDAEALAEACKVFAGRQRRYGGL